jgi:hypothetical protein
MYSLVLTGDKGNPGNSTSKLSFVDAFLQRTAADQCQMPDMRWTTYIRLRAEVVAAGRYNTRMSFSGRNARFSWVFCYYDGQFVDSYDWTILRSPLLDRHHF